jgi:hypothetical protein
MFVSWLIHFNPKWPLTEERTLAELMPLCNLVVPLLVHRRTLDVEARGSRFRDLEERALPGYDHDCARYRLTCSHLQNLAINRTTG